MENPQKTIIDKFEGEYQTFVDEGDFVLDFVPTTLGQKFSIRGRLRKVGFIR